MVSKDFFEKYKPLLLKEKEKVLAEIKEIETPLIMEDEPGLDDEIDEAEEYFNKTSSLSVFKERLASIDSALLKIEKGTYGICEKCGEEIEKEVLDTFPESRFCRECNKANS